jgi:addiction module HigA family antidote
MTEYAAKRSTTRCPSHPGALLREDVIPATGRTKTEIADMLGVSRQHLHDVVAERKPLSPDIAVRVAALFGGSAGVWTRMQAAYDTWHAERSVDVSDIKPLQGGRRWIVSKPISDVIAKLPLKRQFKVATRWKELTRDEAATRKTPGVKVKSYSTGLMAAKKAPARARAAKAKVSKAGRRSINVA